MKINFNNKAILTAAMEEARHNRYYEALCLFCRAPGYESAINQIGCLVKLGDVPTAADTFRRMMAQWGATHNCRNDLMLLGKDAMSVLYFCDDEPLATVADENKISADPSLVAYYSDAADTNLSAEDLSVAIEQLAQGEDGVMLADAPDLDYERDLGQWQSLSPDTGFYDATSEQYFNTLRCNMEKAFIAEDLPTANKLAKALLAIDTYHTATVEAQISLVLYDLNDTDFQNKAKYAAKLAKCSNPTAPGIGGAIEILAHCGKQYLAEIDVLLREATKLLPACRNFDLETYVTVATNFLRNLPLAQQFADELISRQSCRLQSLKLCSIACYNSGQRKRAMQMLRDYNKAVPTDVFAPIFLQYIQSRSDCNDFLTIPPKNAMHYALPHKVVLFCEISLLDQAVAEDQPNLLATDEQYLYLAALINNCKTLILTEDQKGFVKQGTTIRVILKYFEVADAQKFAEFARYQLTALLNEPFVTEGLLAKMLELGCKQKVTLALREHYHTLDLGDVQIDHPLFFEALACYASLHPTDLQVVQKTYLQLVKTLGLDVNAEEYGRSVAYALLRLTDKKFAKSLESQMFSDEEQAIYNEYKYATQK